MSHSCFVLSGEPDKPKPLPLPRLCPRRCTGQKNTRCSLSYQTPSPPKFVYSLHPKGQSHPPLPAKLFPRLCSQLTTLLPISLEKRNNPQNPTYRSRLPRCLRPSLRGGGWIEDPAPEFSLPSAPSTSPHSRRRVNATPIFPYKEHFLDPHIPPLPATSFALLPFTTKFLKFRT